MRVSATAFLSGVAAVATLVLALWVWRHASSLAEMAGAGRPYVATLALRSAAVALAAGAQLVLLAFVTGRIYPRQMFDVVLRFSAGLIAALALVGAIALGLAGR